ncbi:DUF7688 family protein [Neptuniibacter halophilus]|uniref:DUF7688 family protein n=1 Tax=Neptuniibacter halophilus TaxID=651666 RepID=UPI0025740CF6|nr:hypothetical protein [Neptuniibacter halophilus]
MKKGLAEASDQEKQRKGQALVEKLRTIPGAEFYPPLNALLNSVPEDVADVVCWPDEVANALSDAEVMTHELILNGKRLLQGDETSIKVIFNNLTGLNFTPERRPHGEPDEHELYLADMAHAWGVSEWRGDILLQAFGGEVMKTHNFC